MTEIQRQIRALAAQKGALILSHFYQTMDIQAVADVVGDSFELARRARQAAQPIIVLCGVRFMAESAKLLNPDKTVLLPAPDAGCPMADMVAPEDVDALREKHPGAAVMCYVNSSAAVKAKSDVCCTSSSAVRIARALPQRDILFLPDQNLGAYVAAQVPEKNLILFDGYCPIHHAVRPADVLAARAAHPDARVVVHPECRPDVVALADFVGSTAELLAHVENSPPGGIFVVGTETGVVERLRQTAPDKTVYLLKAGFVCPNMKKTRLSDLLRALETGAEAVEVDATVAAGAQRALERMVAL
ncbi:MAG: quinolinate synthase NadA [Oscillospiraceae bacterium]|nr:quinolinate synthase NadA [Oscillospiraceae bacterium]